MRRNNTNITAPTANTVSNRKVMATAATNAAKAPIGPDRISPSQSHLSTAEQGRYGQQDTRQGPETGTAQKADPTHRTQRKRSCL